MTAEAESEGHRAALRKLRHDLSNPLAALLAETQILLLTPEQFDAESLGSLKQIETLARKMRQILQELTE